jgi:glycosyltransferase involved in cell wall biosynthesis
MKIALVHTPLWGRGGAERQVLTLAIELQKLGNEVELFTPAVNEETCYPELLKQITVHTLPQNRFIQFKPRIGASVSSVSSAGEIVHGKNRLQTIAVHQFYTVGLPSMLNLGKIIPKGFDIINNHNAPTEWAAFTAKRRLKIPVVWMCNEPPSWFYFDSGKGIGDKLSWPLFEIWDKASVRGIDEIMVLSHVAEGLVRDVYDRSSRIIRSGLDTEKFRNKNGNELRKKLGLEKDFILLQTANLAPVKRQADSIMALYSLSKRHGNITLILDGSGPQESLKRLVDRLGLTKKVIFWHSKCDKELTEMYAACDVFVFPAQITWGLAVVEAMAAGKPVVVTKKCGAAEIIEDNINGMLVNASSPEEIAKKVELLIGDPTLRRTIGENGFAYVKANLSWKKYAENMETIFQKLVSKRDG